MDLVPLNSQPATYTSFPDRAIEFAMEAFEPSVSDTGLPFFQYVAIILVPLNLLPATYTSFPDTAMEFANDLVEPSVSDTGLPFFQYLPSS